jgi:hypothetical protein
VCFTFETAGPPGQLQLLGGLIAVVCGGSSLMLLVLEAEPHLAGFLTLSETNAVFARTS